MLEFKNTPQFLTRSALLFGEEKLQNLINSHILVLGIGGVGAFAAEMLVRSGLGKITIVDGDCVEYTNLNRQLVALNSTIGEEKTAILKQRLNDINPDCQVTAIQEFIRDEKIEKLLLSAKFDYVIDAIDSLSPKVFFLAACQKHEIPVISSMGSGGRVDPTLVTIADISKTYNCSLARAVRKRLKSLGISKNIMTVFSPEEVPATAVYAYTDEEGFNHSMTGTVSYMPCVFGCTLASFVIRKLTSI